MSERDEFEAYVAFLKRRAGEGQREAWLAALDFKASALTDGQIVDMWNRSMGDVSGLSSRAIAFARALLRATPPQAVPALTDEPQCRTCGGRGTVNRSERVGESDFEEWEDDCPVCGGAGSAPEHVQKLQAALEAAWLDLHNLRMRVGASSLFAAAPQPSQEQPARQKYQD